MKTYQADQIKSIALLGNSGSGKTTMATAIMRLLRPPASVQGGQMLLDGKAQEVDVLFRRYRDNSFGPVKTRPNNKLSKNDHQ